MSNQGSCYGAEMRKNVDSFILKKIAYVHRGIVKVYLMIILR